MMRIKNTDIDVDINAGKNSMAAQMACIEIETPQTFIALAG